MKLFKYLLLLPLLAYPVVEEREVDYIQKLSPVVKQLYPNAIGYLADVSATTGQCLVKTDTGWAGGTCGSGSSGAESFTDLSGMLGLAQIPDGLITEAKLNQSVLDRFFSGNYADLAGLPTLFSGDYNDLSNLPTLFSGNYDDLTNKPVIPSGGGGSGEDNVQADWNETDNTSDAFIQNKPTLFSGNYDDLSGLPTIPTPFSGNYNDLSNLPDISEAGDSLELVPDLDNLGSSDSNDEFFIGAINQYVKQSSGLSAEVLTLSNPSNLLVYNTPRDFIGDENSGIAFYTSTLRSSRPINFLRYQITGNTLTYAPLTENFQPSISSLSNTTFLLGDKTEGLLFRTPLIFYSYEVNGDNINIKFLPKTGFSNSNPIDRGMLITGNKDSGVVWGGNYYDSSRFDVVYVSDFIVYRRTESGIDLQRLSPAGSVPSNSNTYHIFGNTNSGILFTMGSSPNRYVTKYEVTNNTVFYTRLSAINSSLYNLSIPQNNVFGDENSGFMMTNDRRIITYSVEGNTITFNEIESPESLTNISSSHIRILVGDLSSGFFQLQDFANTYLRYSFEEPGGLIQEKRKLSLDQIVNVPDPVIQADIESLQAKTNQLEVESNITWIDNTDNVQFLLFDIEAVQNPTTEIPEMTFVSSLANTGNQRLTRGLATSLAHGLNRSDYRLKVENINDDTYYIPLSDFHNKIRESSDTQTAIYVYGISAGSERSRLFLDNTEISIEKATHDTIWQGLLGSRAVTRVNELITAGLATINSTISIIQTSIANLVNFDNTSQKADVIARTKQIRQCSELITETQHSVFWNGATTKADTFTATSSEAITLAVEGSIANQPNLFLRRTRGGSDTDIALHNTFTGSEQDPSDATNDAYFTRSVLNVQSSDVFSLVIKTSRAVPCLDQEVQSLTSRVAGFVNYVLPSILDTLRSHLSFTHKTVTETTRWAVKTGSSFALATAFTFLQNEPAEAVYPPVSTPNEIVDSSVTMSVPSLASVYVNRPGDAGVSTVTRGKLTGIGLVSSSATIRNPEDRNNHNLIVGFKGYIPGGSASPLISLKEKGSNTHTAIFQVEHNNDLNGVRSNEDGHEETRDDNLYLYEANSGSTIGLFEGTGGQTRDWIIREAQTYTIHFSLTANNLPIGSPQTLEYVISNVGTTQAVTTHTIDFDGRHSQDFKITYVSTTTDYGGTGHTLRISVDQLADNQELDIDHIQVRVSEPVTYTYKYNNTYSTTRIEPLRANEAFDILFMFREVSGKLQVSWAYNYVGKSAVGSGTFNTNRPVGAFDWGEIQIGGSAFVIQHINGGWLPRGLANNQLPDSAKRNEFVQKLTDLDDYVFEELVPPQVLTREVDTFKLGAKLEVRNSKDEPYTLDNVWVPNFIKMKKDNFIVPGGVKGWHTMRIPFTVPDADEELPEFNRSLPLNSDYITLQTHPQDTDNIHNDPPAISGEKHVLRIEKTGWYSMKALPSLAYTENTPNNAYRVEPVLNIYRREDNTKDFERIDIFLDYMRAFNGENGIGLSKILVFNHQAYLTAGTELLFTISVKVQSSSVEAGMIRNLSLGRLWYDNVFIAQPFPYLVMTYIGTAGL